MADQKLVQPYQEPEGRPKKTQKSHLGLNDGMSKDNRDIDDVVQDESTRLKDSAQKNANNEVRQK